ncbi:hypothetical protein Zmor_003942, partial [Zophobas morio]
KKISLKRVTWAAITCPVMASKFAHQHAISVSSEPAAEDLDMPLEDNVQRVQLKIPVKSLIRTNHGISIRTRRNLFCRT